MNIDLAETTAEQVYRVHGAPNVQTKNRRRPLTIRPDLLTIWIRDGQAWGIRVEGVTVRRDGSDGARRATAWTTGGREPMPAWVADHLTSTGLPQKGLNQS